MFLNVIIEEKSSTIATAICNCDCPSRELVADIERIRLELTILKSIVQNKEATSSNESATLTINNSRVELEAMKYEQKSEIEVWKNHSSDLEKRAICTEEERDLLRLALKLVVLSKAN